MEGNQEAEHQGSGRRAKEEREETRRIGPARTLVLHPAKTVTQVELEEAAALQAVAWKATVIIGVNRPGPGNSYTLTPEQIALFREMLARYDEMEPK